MLENDSSDNPLVSRAQVVGIRLNSLEYVGAQPKLGFRISLLAVNVHGFIALVGIEEKSPPHDDEYRRHPKPPSRMLPFYLGETAR
jgi:hypothetical protein